MYCVLHKHRFPSFSTQPGGQLPEKCASPKPHFCAEFTAAPSYKGAQRVIMRKEFPHRNFPGTLDSARLDDEADLGLDSILHSSMLLGRPESESNLSASALTSFYYVTHTYALVPKRASEVVQPEIACLGSLTWLNIHLLDHPEAYLVLPRRPGLNQNCRVGGQKPLTTEAAPERSDHVLGLSFCTNAQQLGSRSMCCEQARAPRNTSRRACLQKLLHQDLGYPETLAAAECCLRLLLLLAEPKG